MTSELKPCPLCGGEAITTREFWEGAAPAGSMFADEAGCPDCGVWLPTAEWNTRAERTCKNPCIAGFMCSECGASCGGFPLIGTANVPWRYCPNCGAKVTND